MTGPFGALKFFPVLFKVLGCLILVLMLTGVVGTVMSRDTSVPFQLQAPILLNMVFSGILAFLLLYAFGEVIRLLLAIESQTRKE